MRECGPAWHGKARQGAAGLGEAWGRTANFSVEKQHVASRIFFGDMPTKPEVNALIADIPAEPGTSIGYQEIERIIAVPAKSSRFNTITRAWRKRLRREKGLRTDAEGGAFHFLTADAAQDASLDQMTRVGRAAGRMVRDLGVVRPEELSTDERREKQRLLVREAAALLEAARASSRNLLEPAPKTGSRLRIAK